MVDFDFFEDVYDPVAEATTEVFSNIFGGGKDPVNIPDGGNGFQQDLNISGGWSNKDGFDAVGLGGEFASNTGELAGNFAAGVGGQGAGLLASLGEGAWDFIKENPEAAAGLLGGAAQMVLADKNARDQRKHETNLANRRHGHDLEQLAQRNEHILEQIEKQNDNQNERYWVQSPNLQADKLGGRQWANYNPTFRSRRDGSGR